MKKTCKEMLALSHGNLVRNCQKIKNWLQEIRGEPAANYEQINLQINMIYKTKLPTKTHGYTFNLCGNGPPCPSFGSISQWNEVLAYGAMEEMGEWLERKGSQGTHTGSIMIGRE